MKKFFKGFGIQLLINFIAHLIRIVIAYFIIKYMPIKYSPEYLVTSFAKESIWQLMSLFFIILYNFIVLVISFISVLYISIFRIKMKDPKLLIGLVTGSILGIIYAIKFLI